MKKLLLLSALFIFACGSDSDENNPQQECNCVKTSYHQYFATSSSNSLRRDIVGTENVACQDEEVQVTTSSDSSGSDIYFYEICCGNIDDDIANICNN
ncbi:hypothetical protein N9D26_00150 [bacterium]|nr:hypothetical protein [bacterium]